MASGEPGTPCAAAERAASGRTVRTRSAMMRFMSVQQLFLSAANAVQLVHLPHLSTQHEDGGGVIDPEDDDHRGSDYPVGALVVRPVLHVEREGGLEQLEDHRRESRRHR